jgi:hypothetical protein
VSKRSDDYIKKSFGHFVRLEVLRCGSGYPACRCGSRESGTFEAWAEPTLASAFLLGKSDRRLYSTSPDGRLCGLECSRATCTGDDLHMATSGQRRIDLPLRGRLNHSPWLWISIHFQDVRAGILFTCCSICTLSTFMNTSLMELGFSRAEVLRFLELCSRGDDRAPDCRPLLARIQTVRLPYDYLALSGPVHDILKLDVFLSNSCLFRGWFHCQKAIAESNPLRALTASDRVIAIHCTMSAPVEWFAGPKTRVVTSNLRGDLHQRTMGVLPGTLSGKIVKCYRNNFLGRIRRQLGFPDPWLAWLSNSP